MLSEQTQIHVGWFVGCLTFVWMFLSRRLIAWIGVAFIAGYCARWGAAFSAGRRAANLITDLTKRAIFITGIFLFILLSERFVIECFFLISVAKFQHLKVNLRSIFMLLKALKINRKLEIPNYL